MLQSYNLTTADFGAKITIGVDECLGRTHGYTRCYRARGLTLTEAMWLYTVYSCTPSQVGRSAVRVYTARWFCHNTGRMFRDCSALWHFLACSAIPRLVTIVIQLLGQYCTYMQYLFSSLGNDFNLSYLFHNLYLCGDTSTSALFVCSYFVSISCSH